MLNFVSCTEDVMSDSNPDTCCLASEALATLTLIRVASEALWNLWVNFHDSYSFDAAR